MSLTYVDAADGRVNHGNTGTDPTAGSLYMWFQPIISVIASRSLFRKITVALNGQWSLATAASNGVRTSINYSTTNADSRSTAGLVANVWNFIGTSFDGSTAPHIYRGDLTTACTELTYNINNAPVGSRVTDGGAPVLIGNIESPAGAYSASPNMFMAMVHWIPGTVLSLSDFQAHQYRPFRLANSKILCFYGLNSIGLGTQQDWSGAGNNGTVLGGVGNIADNPNAQPPLDMSLIKTGMSSPLSCGLVQAGS